MNNAQVFFSILNDVDVDYSMGDYTDIAFDFIEDKSLDEEFYEFVFKVFESQLYERGCEDRYYADEIEEEFEPQKFKWPKLQEFYNKGVKAAEAELNA